MRDGANGRIASHVYSNLQAFYVDEQARQPGLALLERLTLPHVSGLHAFGKIGHALLRRAVGE